MNKADPSRSRRLPPEGHPHRYVFIDADACPACRSLELKSMGTRSSAGGEAVLRYTRCLGPGCRISFERFSGNVQLPAGRRLRYVHQAEPRCPACLRPQPRTYRTTRYGGAVARHSECRGCGARFIVVADAD
jgi:transcriptional regulator NrdR family protein